MNEHYRPTTLDDLPYLIKNLTDEDVAELAANNSTPEDSLRYSYLACKHCFTMIEIETGLPMGIFGFSDGYGSSTYGIIWAMTTPTIYKHKLRFYRTSKQFVSEVQQLYPLLMNYVWEGNKSHINWLKSLGFIFISKKSINNNNFYEFVRV